MAKLLNTVAAERTFTLEFSERELSVLRRILSSVSGYSGGSFGVVIGIKNTLDTITPPLDWRGLVCEGTLLFTDYD